MLIVLEKPVLSEKSMKLAGRGWYTFLVNKGVDKPTIIKTVEGQFKVKVTSVKILNFKSKKRLQKNRRGYYQTTGYKKAIVQLKANQKIEGFIPAEEKPVEVKTAESSNVVKEKKSLRGTKVKVEAVKKGGKP